MLDDIATSPGGENKPPSKGPNKPRPHKNPTYVKMQKRYGNIMLAQFSERLLEKDFKSFVLVKEKELMDRYKFNQQ